MKDEGCEMKDDFLVFGAVEGCNRLAWFLIHH